MLVNRVQLLIILGVSAINLGLYYLNEELLIYSVSLVFVALVYILVRKLLVNNFLTKTYNFYTNYALYQSAEETYNYKLKLLLIEAKINLQMEQISFKLHQKMLRNQETHLFRLVKLNEALRHKFFIKNAIAQEQLRLKDSKKITKPSGKFKPKRPL